MGKKRKEHGDENGIIWLGRNWENKIEYQMNFIYCGRKWDKKSIDGQ